MAKVLYTKELGRIVAGRTSARVAPGRYHVISSVSQKWTVVPEGRIRPLKAFATQEQAVSFAKRNARKMTGVVIVHGKTGQIRDTISYAK